MEAELFSHPKDARLLAWKVKEGGYVKKGHVIFDYAEMDDGSKTLKYRATKSGVVTKIFVRKGDSVVNGSPLLTLEKCSHSTVITDLCAVCGIDFQQLEENAKPTGTSVSMIHSVPNLKCSIKEAREISKAEETRLLKQRKLHLLVDLDQTLIHTTNMDVPPFVNDVLHFRLPGSPLMYHTRLRPGTRPFLEKISNMYELHICTFGSRNYAHSIAKYLDPDGKLFYIRILSRDECFSQNSKTANLQELFPSGDHMVCIIDDREDVWNFTPSLIHVKPYHFFSKTGDINAPPSLTKREDDNKTGFEFSGDGVKQLANASSPEVNKAKVVEADSTTTDVLKEPAQIKSNNKANDELSKDLMLTDDESDTSTEKDNVDSDSSSTSSDPTEVSTPKPDVPHVFDDDEEASKENIQSAAPMPETSGQNPIPAPAETKEKEAKTKEKDKEVVEKVLEKPKGEKLEVTEGKEEKVAELSDEEKRFLVPDADDYLMYLEDILERIHKAFYQEYDLLQASGGSGLPNVKQVIPNIRKNVLKGCSLVFSGVVPVGSKLEHSRAFGVAVSLGATVTDKFITPRKASQPSTSKELQPTTHVVAARLGTAKTNEGRRYKGVHIVTPDWLWCCAERWDHVDERLFNLCKKSTVRRHPPAHLATDIDSEGSSNQEQAQDDDAFLSDEKSAENGERPATGSRRVRTLSGRFMDTINPLLSFSMDEIADMDHEVDDICALSGSSSDDDDEPRRREKVVRRKKTRESIEHRISEYKATENSSSSDSSGVDDEDSISRDRALKRKRDLPPPEEEPEEEESLFTKFRRGEALPSDVEMLNLTNQTSDDDNDVYVDQDNEWMARQLEAELLGGGDSSQDGP